MKTFIIILFFVAIVYPIDGLKERLQAVQQTQNNILQKESVQPMPMIPMNEPKSEPAARSYEMRRYVGDRITRLEVQQQYMQKDVDNNTKTLQDTREILIQVVATLEKANKVTEVQTDKSARADLILNIIIGIVTIVSGGGGFFVWKNKHLVFKKKEEKSTTEEKS